eukprot:NODE_3955_length_507_cov_59.711790_g3369_i0.p2 GENE.NODE_3955_length_507_cov_59.711790_g3369_i0~~NODE_3955_length_507_cov_59.711790_g3369_i0.p2  ORF type:complete len:80 (+),score=21.02 NODE_3955_length_507_cov_59.711790_g3369_i0:131-370(+)
MPNPPTCHQPRCPPTQLLLCCVLCVVCCVLCAVCCVLCAVCYVIARLLCICGASSNGDEVRDPTGGSLGSSDENRGEHS